MRVDTLTIGLLLTIAIAGCGERTPTVQFAVNERANRVNDQDRHAHLAQQMASGGKTSEEAPVRDAESACATAKLRVTGQRGLPISHVAYCDQIPEADAPSGYYVQALRAHCSDEPCGSTNMGWFAVRKATGDVFEWNVADWKLGQPISGDH